MAIFLKWTYLWKQKIKNTMLWMTGCSQACRTEMKRQFGNFKEQPELAWTAPLISSSHSAPAVCLSQERDLLPESAGQPILLFFNDAVKRSTENSLTHIQLTIKTNGVTFPPKFPYECKSNSKRAMNVLLKCIFNSTKAMDIVPAHTRETPSVYMKLQARDECTPQVYIKFHARNGRT